MFRFVHTADVHLDSPLKSLALRDPDLAELVGVATRTAFRRTVDLCLSEQVDAFIIAGDLYDGSLRSMKTARFFAEEMRRLTEADISAFIIRGNHDAESVITREMTLPEGVHVFSNTDKPIPMKDGAVAIHGVSFKDVLAPESLLPKYQPGTPGVIDIGAMHTSLDGSPHHDVYAPCSTTDLAAHGYAYWALGHIHKRSVIRHNECTIVMPGIPQGRHINEDGLKSVSLVSVATNGACEIEERYVAPVRFERLELDASDAADWPALITAAVETFTPLHDATVDQDIILRITCRAGGSFGRTLQRDVELLEEELQSAASRVGRIYIEQVVCEIKESTPVENSRASDLSAIIESGKIDRGLIATRLQGDLLQLIQRLPAELRAEFDPNSNQDLLDRLTNDGITDLLLQIEHGD
ncbi:MAG: DNA repair exonuclease [Henriciella sp.]|nr:DNA repair exonuclease [Henriciella sp.]